MRISKVVMISVFVLILLGTLNTISLSQSYEEVEESSSSTEPKAVAELSYYLDSDPILIENDEAFGPGGYDFPGTGHIDHPYIIENYIIDSPSTRPGIYVIGTTKYFVIRNCYFANQENGVLIDTIAEGTATISDNIAINNGQGFDIRDSNYLAISGNIADSNTYCGFILTRSSHNVLSGNEASNSNYGFCLSMDSNNNILSENSAENNWCGVYLNHNSNDNLVYHNNFMDNYGRQVWEELSMNNYWYNPNLLEGNYYSDWTTPDDVAPFGIVDFPYAIGGSADGDLFPLTTPFTPPANNPPTADAGEALVIDEGSTAVLDASGSSDPDGDVLQFRWDFESDGTWDTGWSDSPTATKQYDDDYFGLATVEVTDGELSATDTVDITVDNVPPVVIPRGSLSLLEGLYYMPVTLVWFTDPGTSDTHTAYIEWGDDEAQWGTVSEVNGKGSVGPHCHVYANDHDFIIKVWVFDDDGAVAFGYIDVTVKNVAPMPSIDLVVSPSGDFILPGDEVEFYGSVWDPGIYDKIFTEWDFGDGSPVIHGGLTPTHTFAQPGEYTVTLTASDELDSQSVTVTIVVDTHQDVAEDIQDDLLAIDPPPEAQDDIDKASSNLNDAIDAFENEDIKTAYDELEDVVRDLMKAQAEGADTQEVIDDILSLLEDVARLAINDAIEAVGADDERVMKAQECFDLALACINAGEYDKAVDEFRKAYEEAMKTLE